MSRNVLVTIATQSDQLQSANPSGGLRITLVNADSSVPPVEPIVLASGPYAPVFSGVVAGTYTAYAQPIDTTGAAVGSPSASLPYVVADLPTTSAFDVPVQITISAAA